MREILFRGKRTDGGEWVYGYPVGWQNEGVDISIVDSRFGACIDESGNLMMFEAPFVTKVAPSTVGQYTGLTDKNGKMIFEGDIVIGENYLFPCYDNRKLIINWHENIGGFLMSEFNLNDIEVIGNIHDNPELLKEAT